MDDIINRIFNAQMTSREFETLSTFIYKEYGIKMPPAKKVMLQSRLQKRLRELNILSYKDYIDFLFDKKNGDDEIINMIDVVSTNKTDFFRESTHFDFIRDSVLPDFLKQNRTNYFVRAWSAGCSSGEEVYTLAMVMNDFADSHPGFDFSIFGTDISSRILKKAVMAIFPEERIEVVPFYMKKKYLLKSKDHDKRSVRIVPELRRKTTFKRLNFMDKAYDIHETFDLIMCRNVLIYFDRETQESVINKLCTKLKPGGYFFLGHSESIMNINVPLQQLKPTIFIRI